MAIKLFQITPLGNLKFLRNSNLAGHEDDEMWQILDFIKRRGTVTDETIKSQFPNAEDSLYQLQVGKLITDIGKVRVK